MYPDKATPLIVCGRQRAGTRYVTDVLNSFDEVTLQGEIPNPVMKALEKFITDTEAYYRHRATIGDSRHKEQYPLWARKKPELIFSMWANASQSRRFVPGKNCRYYGYKRPNNEFYFDFYEEHLAAVKPHYIYCVRSFPENYLSISSRWPDRTIKMVANDYLKSVGKYNEIKARAPDRVHLFNLDDHILHGFEYMERNIIAKLGLAIDEELRTQLKAVGARNRTDKVAKKARRLELTGKEEAFIRSHPALEVEFRKLCCDSQGNLR